MAKAQLCFPNRHTKIDGEYFFIRSHDILTDGLASISQEREIFKAASNVKMKGEEHVVMLPLYGINGKTLMHEFAQHVEIVQEEDDFDMLHDYYEDEEDEEMLTKIKEKRSE